MGVCFLIGPYGAERSIERQWSDFVLHEIVQPACGQAYEAKRTIDDPDIDPTHTITAHILETLDAADIVCADLTGHNANAFYELGVRHAKGRPFIQLCRHDTPLPFDVQMFPTLMLRAEYVEALKMYAMTSDDKREAVRILSDRIRAISERQTREPARPRTSDTCIFRFYLWKTQYAVSIHTDWLAKQRPELQHAVEAYERDGGDAAIQLCDEVSFVEYLELKGAANRAYRGKLWCVANRGSGEIVAGYAVYEFTESSLLIDLTGTYDEVSDTLTLTFDQPGRPVKIGRFNVELPAYSYTVEFKKSNSGLHGLLKHPVTDTVVGKARLNPTYGF